MHALVVLVAALCLAGVSASKIQSPTWGGCSNGLELLNGQLRLELQASQQYLSWGQHYARDTEAYPGLSRFFMAASDEERQHAVTLLEYMNKRGIKAQMPVVELVKEETRKPLDVVRAALQFEKDVTANLEALFACSDDAHMQHFIQHEFLSEQVDAIKQLADLVTQLERLVKNEATLHLGMHLFDQQLLSAKQ